MRDTHCSIRRNEGRRLFPMPESSADTFWGKGFLATALGTASPDRKKIHKGQTFSWSCGDALVTYREKKRAVSTSDACKNFLRQVVFNKVVNYRTQLTWKVQILHGNRKYVSLVTPIFIYFLICTENGHWSTPRHPPITIEAIPKRE